MSKASNMQIKYFGVNQRVKVESKYYEGPLKRRELESVIEYKAVTKRITDDSREIDFLVKTLKDKFRCIGEVEVYQRLNKFDYEIMVRGKKEYLKQVFKDIL